jgi:hypothetical protein
MRRYTQRGTIWLRLRSETFRHNLQGAGVAGAFTGGEPTRSARDRMVVMAGSGPRGAIFSAFAGTDLDMVLRAGAVETLVLAGIATSAVVLSTIRHAADADCCADRDPEVHRVLAEKVFLRKVVVAMQTRWSGRSPGRDPQGARRAARRHGLFPGLCDGRGGDPRGVG